jgi:tetratricopeptide (TPR) repeat protein
VTTRSFVLAFASALALAAPTPAPGAATEPDAFARALSAREARWNAERGRPEAALAVLGTMDLWDLTDPQAISAFLGRAALDPRADPLARAHAAELAEEASVRRGDAAAAARFRAELGLIETWRVIGPFGFDGGDLIGTPYGPERGIAASEPGKRGEVVWRDVPAAWMRHGAVPLGAMLRPDSQAAAYGLTWVWSDGPRDVAVRFGSTGATRVWVGGALVAETKVKSRMMTLDQEAASARLGRGWNPILVKVAVDDGGWAFVLRLTELGGRPLALRAVATPPDSEALVTAPPGAGATLAGAATGATAGTSRGGAAKAAKAVAAKAPATLRAHLEARAQKAKGAAKAKALADLAVFHEEVGPDDPAAKPVESTLSPLAWEEGPADAAVLLIAARAAESPDARRRAAERAAATQAATATEKAEAHWRLSSYYLGEQGQLRRAREELELALAADPSFWPAELGLIHVLGALGLDELGRARAEALVVARPHATQALRRLAGLEAGAGRPDRARRLYEALAKVNLDDVGPWARLGELAKDRGDRAAWLAALEKVRALRPTAVGSALALAAALVDRGEIDRALAIYDDALVVAPDDPRLLEESGRLMLERGGAARQGEGEKRLRRALVVRPQNPDLRRYLSRAAPADGDDLEQKYAKDPRPIIAGLAAWETRAEGAVVLLDLSVTRVHENGLSETFVQRLVRIQDQTGAAGESVQGVHYSPATQSVELRTARVHKASGEIAEAKTQGTQEISEPWYNLYYDIRADVVGFERLEPGDVVEFSYVLADSGRRNLFGDYFGDLHFLASAVPTGMVDYTVLAPKTRALHWHVPVLPGLSRSDDTTAAGEVRTRFVVHKVPKVETDAGMPGFSEAAPYLHVSTWKSWDQVARWYWRLAEEQLVADAAVKAAAKTAAAGLTDERAKVRAIHNLVVKKTRYVGLELGIHSFKPYRTTEVFERKFGDCKDKASLIVVMLREVGVEAQLVLVRTRKNGDVADAPASLAVFDHAIAYVPSLDLYLDGTAEFSGSGELPWQDQNVMVLRIDGQDGLLTRTPILPPEKNLERRTLTLDVSAFGQPSKMREDVTVTGQGAASWRQQYQAEAERGPKYEKAWNAVWPGFRLGKVVMPTLADLEQPVTARADGLVPQLGVKLGSGAWSLPLLAHPSEIARSFGRTSKRRHDLLLPYPFVNVDEVVWILPKGAKVLQAPRAAQLSSAFGELGLSVEIKDGERTEVHVRAMIKLTQTRVSLADYPSFREFLGQVDAALNQPIEVAP